DFPSYLAQRFRIALGSIDGALQVERLLRPDVVGYPVALRKDVGLLRGKLRLRQVDLGDRLRQTVCHRHIERLASRNALEVVSQVKERLERNQSLAGEQRIKPLPYLGVGGLLPRAGAACEQRDKRIL